MNTFNEYQDWTHTTAVYNDRVYAEIADGAEVPLPYIYPVLALSEEAGEVAGKVAKFVRKRGYDQVELGELVKKELGDVMYQLARCAYEFGFTLQEIADDNVSKLTDRQERGVLIGEGDNR